MWPAAFARWRSGELRLTPGTLGRVLPLADALAAGRPASAMVAATATSLWLRLVVMVFSLLAVVWTGTSLLAGEGANKGQKCPFSRIRGRVGSRVGSPAAVWVAAARGCWRPR